VGVVWVQLIMILPILLVENQRVILVHAIIQKVVIMIIKENFVLEGNNFNIKQIRNKMMEKIFENYGIFKKQRTKPVIYKKR